MDINSYIGRIVAFALTPVLLPIATTVAVWIQDVAGVDLSGGQLTAYVVAVASGVAITAATWLRNRGQWEVANATIGRLQHLGSYELAGTLDSTADPVQPTGLEPR